MRQVGELCIEQSWREPLRAHGLDTIGAWLNDPRIRIWRDIRERQNGVLDLAGLGRFHVKRIRPPRGPSVRDEVHGIQLLEKAHIRSVPLVAWGLAEDGSGVFVSKDLTGYAPVDQQLVNGRRFRDVLKPTASVAARLHGAGLHHRDLYLCHFLMAKRTVCLIDAARVRPLPWLTRRRWIVKDLAQFRFSGLQAGVAEAEMDEWLSDWALRMRINPRRWRSAVTRKAAWIARHDAQLAKEQPERYASLP